MEKPGRLYSADCLRHGHILSAVSLGKWEIHDSHERTLVVTVSYLAEGLMVMHNSISFACESDTLTGVIYGLDE